MAAGEFSKISATVEEQGYALVRSHRPEASSFDAISDFGNMETVEGLGSLQFLTPKKQLEALPNTYSGIFGVKEFPLHTDLAHWALPPRFLVLRCIHGAEHVTTRIFDGHELVERFRPETLRMTLTQPRRPMRNGKQLLQVYQRVEGIDRYLLRWDSVYLRPATRLSDERFSDIKQFIACVRPVEIKLLERGDTLILDNWRCLHGRADVPEAARHRKIERAYLRTII